MNNFKLAIVLLGGLVTQVLSPMQSSSSSESRDLVGRSVAVVSSSDSSAYSEPALDAPILPVPLGGCKDVSPSLSFAGGQVRRADQHSYVSAPTASVHNVQRVNQAQNLLVRSYNMLLQNHVNSLQSTVQRIVECADPRAMLALSDHKMSFEPMVAEGFAFHAQIVSQSTLNTIGSEVNEAFAPYAERMLEQCFDASGSVRENVDGLKLQDILATYLDEQGSSLHEIDQLLDELVNDPVLFQDHFNRLFGRSYADAIRLYATSTVNWVSSLGTNLVGWFGSSTSKRPNSLAQRVRDNPFNKDIRDICQAISEGDARLAEGIIANYRNGSSEQQSQVHLLEKARNDALIENSLFAHICKENHQVPMVLEIEFLFKSDLLTHPTKVIEGIHKLLSKDSPDPNIRAVYDLFVNEKGLVRFYEYSSDALQGVAMPEAIHLRLNNKQRIALHTHATIVARMRVQHPGLFQAVEYLKQSCGNANKEVYLSLAQSVHKAFLGQGPQAIIHCRHLHRMPRLLKHNELHARCLEFVADTLSKLGSDRHALVHHEMARSLISVDKMWGAVVDGNSSRIADQLTQVLHAAHPTGRAERNLFETAQSRQPQNDVDSGRNTSCLGLSDLNLSHIPTFEESMQTDIPRVEFFDRHPDRQLCMAIAAPQMVPRIATAVQGALPMITASLVNLFTSAPGSVEGSAVLDAVANQVEPVHASKESIGSEVTLHDIVQGIKVGAAPVTSPSAGSMHTAPDSNLGFKVRSTSSGNHVVFDNGISISVGSSSASSQDVQHEQNRDAYYKDVRDTFSRLRYESGYKDSLADRINGIQAVLENCNHPDMAIRIISRLMLADSASMSLPQPFANYLYSQRAQLVSYIYDIHGNFKVTDRLSVVNDAITGFHKNCSQIFIDGLQPIDSSSFVEHKPSGWKAWFASALSSVLAAGRRAIPVDIVYRAGHKPNNQIVLEFVVACSQGDHVKAQSLLHSINFPIKHELFEQYCGQKQSNVGYTEHGLLACTQHDPLHDRIIEAYHADSQEVGSRDLWNDVLLARHFLKNTMVDKWGITDLTPLVEQGLYQIIDANGFKSSPHLIDTVAGVLITHPECFDAVIMGNGVMKDFAHYERAQTLPDNSDLTAADIHTINHLVYLEKHGSETVQSTAASLLDQLAKKPLQSVHKEAGLPLANDSEISRLEVLIDRCGSEHDEVKVLDCGGDKQTEADLTPKSGIPKIDTDRVDERGGHAPIDSVGDKDASDCGSDALKDLEPKSTCNYGAQVLPSMGAEVEEPQEAELPAEVVAPAEEVEVAEHADEVDTEAGQHEDGVRLVEGHDVDVSAEDNSVAVIVGLVAQHGDKVVREAMEAVKLTPDNFSQRPGALNQLQRQIRKLEQKNALKKKDAVEDYKAKYGNEETVKLAEVRLKGIPGLEGKDGPLKRIKYDLAEGAGWNKGSLYELEVALTLQGQGEEIVGLNEKYHLPDIKMVEIDLVTKSGKFIECKNVQWENVKKQQVRLFKNACHNGKKVARSEGAQYIVFSRHEFTKELKTWLEGNDIMYTEGC